MTKKEIISLILLIVVVGYGAWNWINRSYSETKRDLDLLDTVVTISATSKSKDIGTQIDSVFAYIRTFKIFLTIIILKAGYIKSITLRVNAIL